MKFDVEKCRVMHVGINNDNVKYLMNGVELSVTTIKTNPGVNQCSKLVGFIVCTFEHK